MIRQQRRPARSGRRAFTRSWSIVLAITFALAACGAPSLPVKEQVNQQPPRPEIEAYQDGPPAPLVSEGSEARRDSEEDMVVASLTPNAERDAFPSVVPPGAIKVGLLVPLTGRYAREGKALLDAAQLALFDVADERFMLIPRDTGGSPPGAAAAARELIDDGVNLILGPLFSEEVTAVAPLARSRGINVVAFSTDPAVAGEGVFLLGHTSRQQVLRLVSFARSQGLSRFAVLAPATPYGRTIVNQMREAVATNGAVLTRVAIYAPDASDAEVVVRDLADYDRRRRALQEQKDALAGRDDEGSRLALKRLEAVDTFGEVPYDALLIADGGARLRQVAPLLPYYDIEPGKVKLMGTGLWDDPEVRKETTLQGAWYVGPVPEAREIFTQRYKAVYGAEPDRLATLAYDATALAAALARRQRDAPFGALALSDPRGFFGADGIFRFGVEGLAERGLAVLEIKSAESVDVISPAPTRFAAGTLE